MVDESVVGQGGVSKSAGETGAGNITSPDTSGVKAEVVKEKKDLGVLLMIYVLYKANLFPRTVLAQIMKTLSRDGIPGDLAGWLVREASR